MKLKKILSPIKPLYYVLLRIKTYIKCFIKLQLLPIIRLSTGRKYTQDIKNFHNKHKGERIFLIASGPSLTEEDVLKLKNENTIAVNAVITLCKKLDWKPTYYCLGDHEVYDRLLPLLNELKLENCFLDANLRQRGKKEFAPYYFENRHWGVAYLEDESTVRRHTKFSSDVYKDGVFACRSITYTAMQLAAYFGFTEIYILGVDNGNYVKGRSHFGKEGNPDDEDGKLNVSFQEKFCLDNEISYQIAEDFSRKNGFRIYNVTRGGYVKAFERVNLDNILHGE